MKTKSHTQTYKPKFTGRLPSTLNHLKGFQLIRKPNQVFVITLIHAKVTAQLKNRLIEELGDRIESIVLYGSVAKNTAHEESDIDILIVTREDDKNLYDKISKIRTQIDLENNTLTALLHVTNEEIEHYTKLGSPFIKSVAEEGVILHDRGNFKKLRSSILGKS
jgi:predicted nucleotidyltransferase